uniref:Uncharacterized protein n=1 Tax=Avena sativa TaxID=4498 RepID=A0ACD6AGK8_AVESA
MAAKVVAIAFVLLLQTFGKNAFAAIAKPITRNDGGEPPVSQEDNFGVSAYAVKWKPPTSQDNDDFGASAYAVKWNPPASKEDNFGVSSYAVKWKPPTSQDNDDFGASAYAVKWKPPASKENGFAASSYAVHWDEDSAPSHSPIPEASTRSGHVNENGFAASSYAVHWDEDSAPSHSPIPEASARSEHANENGFAASSYAVHWDEDSAPSHSHVPNAAARSEHIKENGFSASSYAVHWDEDSAPSQSPVPKAPARHHHHIKVQTGMLFLKKNLLVGTVLPEGTMFARATLPKSDSSVATPLEPESLAAILSHFKIPHNSMKAKQVADTLRSCVNPGDKEEPRMCFSSREAMARFAAGALGDRRARAAIARIHGHETPTSRYVVTQIAQLSNNTVACHPMDFPYEVYYCHRPKDVQSLMVQLKDVKNGVPLVTTTVMCHMNTSDWDKQYFELLGGEHGEPICHYMPQNYIMFY